MNLTIIYQDQFMVVVDKPANLLVHRSMLDKHETQFAMQIVRDQINQHVFPVHRLDRPTSGVLVFALSSEIARVLGEQFSSHTIFKRYLAIVRGHAPAKGEIDYALKEQLDKIADKLAKKDKEPQSAQTEYHCLHTFELPFAVSRYPSARYSLMELLPKTGRKHQLRRHMAHINHPIVGDTTHGDGKHNRFLRETFGYSGLALTCQSMQIMHPVNKKMLSLSCELPSHFKQLLLGWALSENQLEQIMKHKGDN